MAYVNVGRVRDTSTTTGTGAMTLANAAVAGYRRFSDVLANGDTCSYVISGRYSAGEWEVGIGTYTAAGTTLTRTVVINGSAGVGTAVTFSAGTKDIWLAPLSIEGAVYIAGNTGAAPAPALTNGPVQQWTMNNNVTWGAPTAPWKLGQLLTILAVQDATGSRTTAWNATYRNAPSWAAGAANTKATAMFIYDGTNWQFIGGSTAFA